MGAVYSDRMPDLKDAWTLLRTIQHKERISVLKDALVGMARDDEACPRGTEDAVRAWCAESCREACETAVADMMDPKPDVGEVSASLLEGFVDECRRAGRMVDVDTLARDRVAATISDATSDEDLDGPGALLREASAFVAELGPVVEGGNAAPSATLC